MCYTPFAASRSILCLCSKVNNPNCNPYIYFLFMSVTCEHLIKKRTSCGSGCRSD
ncbi:hypothetical protein HanIR_Chr01g0027601 [Helianthus annuus]|nr:hypothetical protein HanIR_Chr01g0027601 [Helianthus annuus]